MNISGSATLFRVNGLQSMIPRCTWRTQHVNKRLLFLMASDPSLCASCLHGTSPEICSRPKELMTFGR
jgi:hypothetical protein